MAGSGWDWVGFGFEVGLGVPGAAQLHKKLLAQVARRVCSLRRSTRLKGELMFDLEPRRTAISIPVSAQVTAP